MATNGLKGSTSFPETLPPKKRNPRENQSNASAEPIFKTPSPFWKQNGFRGPRKPKEPVPLSLLGLHSASTYHPLWPDVTSDLNPVLECTPRDVSFPTWGQNFASCERPMTWSDSDPSDPVTHSFCWASSYWNRIATEPRDATVPNHRRLHNQRGPPVIKPIPQPMASHYTRGVQRDFPRGEEVRQRVEEEKGGASQWQEKLHIQRVLHGWRARKDCTMKYDPPSLKVLGTEFARHKYYSEFGDSPQAKVAKTEHFHHPPHSGAYPSCSSTERSKSMSEVEAYKRHELPLLVMSGNAQSRKQREPASSSTHPLARFVEGSLIELVGGQLKRVEDLKMEDFMYCTDLCPELSLRRFTVQKITRSNIPGLRCLEVELEDDRHSKMSLEVCEEYPLFVCTAGRGWSSCRPERTAHLCCLRCHQLHPGDVCLALTPTLVPAPRALPEPSDTVEEQANGTERPVEEVTLGRPRKRHSSAPELRNPS